MTTAADALEVLTMVAACHRRTAPKLDDKAAAMATAQIWADLFSTHRLELPDLLAAVKMRAQFDPDAPEPAEIISFARKIRKDRRDKEGPTAAYEALCESKAADAAELAELRAQRELTALIERPDMVEAINTLAAGKTVTPEGDPA